MAKQRKQKQKEHRASDVGVVKADEGVASCCTTVLHQKLCVAIDVAAQRICGHTELKVPVKQRGKIGGVIGLHARGLHIEQVLVDGVEAQFEIEEFHAHIQPPQNSKSLVETADDAYRKYSEDLYLEMQPELLIHPPASSTPAGEEPKDPQEGKLEAGLIDGYSQSGPIVKPETTNVAAVPGSQAEEVRIVRVEYWVEKPASGAHFGSDILHTHNQLRRARCWFPCVDSNLQRCSFDLEFTVNSEYVAVSNGKLLYQVYSNLGTHLKTYVYSLAIPITASSVSLVVAPLVVLPDRHHPTVSHLCLPGLDSTLHSSISFFHTVFGLYEEYLGASFPFGCYKQVFIPGNSAISTTSIGASLAIISGDLLSDEHIIDQAIGTRIKLAHALAQQWFGVFITPDSPADGWLLEGLAGMLTDLFVKRFLGNNEARFRRYKANEAVCLVEVDGAPVLSPPAGLDMDMYGTEKLGVLGKIRSWKATAVVQMLEKQMGPEPFRKVLQRIIMRAQDPNRQIRTLSTTEFRHFANKLGNLERPFLKDFFPRWVESSGCPRLRMGFVYSKRRNMVELAVRRDSTAMPKVVGVSGKAETPGAKLRASDMGWPGMMSIRLHELDGMYDHPSLPMAGDHYQLLELQCHSKLAGRRIQRPKKGAKGDALEENVDTTPAQSLESPLLWLRGDPELEYLAELNLMQPEHMWINQLEKDRDVIGQVQAVAALRAHSRTSFALVNALNNCLVDPKVFCRVRIEAAAALASTASEGTSYMGLQNLIKYYKSHRFDPDIGLPKPNDFHDFAEYFVLESIPGAVAEVRGNDGKSPLEAADFILHILKHNDNNGNTYSDVYWLASVIESIGSLEFGQQNLKILARMLKQIDRFLQYDRLMPSYNGVVTISCIHTLTKLAIRFSQVLPLDRITQLLKTFKDAKIIRWQVRVAALRALLELEFHSKGLEAAAVLALQHISNDPSFAVQSKVMKHVVQLGTMTEKGSSKIGGSTIAQLLGLLECSNAFHNIRLRHYIFCFLQVLAGRSASLYRSAECLAKLAPSQPSQYKRFVKTKNSFKVRLRSTQAAAPAPSSAPVPSPYAKLVVKLKPPVIAERAESGNSGGRRELDEQKGRLVFKLKLPSSSSAQEGPGEDASQALEVSTGAVPMDRVVASSPTSVKQEVNLHEFIDSNPFTQNDTSQVDVLDMHQEEMRGPITETQEAGLEEITQDEGMEENHEGLFEDTEGDASPKASHQGRVGPGSDSDQATMEQEPTFDLNGEDTQDGMGMEMRDRLTKESTFAGVTDVDLQRYNSLSGVAGTESTQDGGGEETESQKRDGKHKKDRKHEKKDKKDRKEKKKKKHDKHNDPEYLEKKRKRKEEKEQRHRQEGHKSVKEDKPRKEERQAVKVEEKAFSGLPVAESIKTEGDTKLKVVFKKRRTTSGAL